MAQNEEQTRIDLTLQVSIWRSFRDNQGKHRAQMTVEETPQVLFDAIPIKARPYLIGRIESKSFAFTFKRKIYTIEFLRSIGRVKP